MSNRTRGQIEGQRWICQTVKAEKLKVRMKLSKRKGGAFEGQRWNCLSVKAENLKSMVELSNCKTGKFSAFKIRPFHLCPLDFRVLRLGNFTLPT